MNKQEALDHLKERRRFFLNKQLFGRAETMQEIYDAVKERDESENFDMIQTTGIYIERLEKYG